MTLTTKQVDAAKPKEMAYKVADSGGLYSYISSAGSKSWRWNFVADRKQGTKTYGTYPEISLAQVSMTKDRDGNPVRIDQVR